MRKDTWKTHFQPKARAPEKLKPTGKATGAQRVSTARRDRPNDITKEQSRQAPREHGRDKPRVSASPANRTGKAESAREFSRAPGRVQPRMAKGPVNGLGKIETTKDFSRVRARAALRPTQPPVKRIGQIEPSKDFSRVSERSKARPTQPPVKRIGQMEPGQVIARASVSQKPGFTTTVRRKTPTAGAKYPSRPSNARPAQPRPEKYPDMGNQHTVLPAEELHTSGLPKLTVDFSDTRSTRVRHVWIYDNMVVEDARGGADNNGKAVAVIEQPGKFLGSAIYNGNSRIRGRLFSLDARPYDAAYVTQALEHAISRRAKFFTPDDSCRLVFGDSDGLPGLVVDKIANVVVVQLLTLATDLHSSLIVEELRRLIRPAGIVLRRDMKVRDKEGLPVQQPEIIGDVPIDLQVEQDGFTVFANVLTGQKTGLFLDQRFNRRLIKPWCHGARVLDLYCHVGAWSFMAAKEGAREVTAVDSSSAAIELASRGAMANKFSNVQFVTSDVFDFLEKEKGSMYDVIVCDPPAFAKTRAHVREAMKAYLSLNYRCMKALPIGGILATSSCSQHVGADEFETMLETAARNARMQFQIVARGGQPPDHPALLGFRESEYLKCVVLQRTE